MEHHGKVGSFLELDTGIFKKPLFFGLLCIARYTLRTIDSLPAASDLLFRIMGQSGNRAITENELYLFLTVFHKFSKPHEEISISIMKVTSS